MCDFCEKNNSNILCKAELNKEYHSGVENNIHIFCDIQGSKNLCLGYILDDEYIVESDVKINYCPICGRKLYEEKELPLVTVGMEDDCK